VHVLKGLCKDFQQIASPLNEVRILLREDALSRNVDSFEMVQISKISMVKFSEELAGRHLEGGISMGLDAKVHPRGLGHSPIVAGFTK
jgi:hypothetical protein